MESLSVKELLEAGDERLNLRLKAGDSGLSRILQDPTIRTSPKTLKDPASESPSEVILIFLSEDLSCLESLSRPERDKRLAKLKTLDIAGVIVPGKDSLPRFLLEFADARGVPLFSSEYDAFVVESRLMGLIRERLHHVLTLQGVFVEVSGLGVLITGASGTGKSECALELLSRGHRLVSDDVTEIEKRGGKLYGRSPEEIKYLMEIRGLGIIHVGDIFGAHAVVDEMAVDLIVEFLPAPNATVLRSPSAVSAFRPVMNVDIPLYGLPTREGSNMATVVEVLAKDHALRTKKERKGQ